MCVLRAHVCVCVCVLRVCVCVCVCTCTPMCKCSTSDILDMYLCPARESEQSSSSTHLARPVALFADLQANSEARLDSHTYQTAHDLCQRSGMRLPDPSPDTTQCQQEFATWLRTEGISGVDGNSFWSAAGASSSALAEGTTTTFCEIPSK